MVHRLNEDYTMNKFFALGFKTATVTLNTSDAVVAGTKRAARGTQHAGISFADGVRAALAARKQPQLLAIPHLPAK